MGKSSKGSLHFELIEGRQEGLRVGCIEGRKWSLRFALTNGEKRVCTLLVLREGKDPLLFKVNLGNTRECAR